MDANYRFHVRFRLDPTGGVETDPEEFEAAVRWPAPPPGEDGWLFFRDRLWRGKLNDPDVRRLLAEALGVPVVGVEFRAFETDDAYLDALEAAIDANLESFRADDVPDVLNKYLGSSIEVRR